MSLIDKMSQMFDDLMEKAIEHHRQSSPFRRNLEKRTIQDVIPTEEAEAAGADVDDAIYKQKEARKDRKEAERRLTRAKSNLVTSTLAYNLSPSNATLRSLQRAKKERKQSGRALHRSRIAEAKAPNRLRKAKEKLAGLGQREVTVEGPPTKQQKAIGIGKMADSMFNVEGLTGSSGDTIAKAATGNPAAIVKLVTDQITGLGKGVGKFLTSEKAADAGSGMFKAGFHGAMLSGPAGMAVAPFMKLGEVIMGSVSKLQDWNESLHEANIKFSEFSGSMTQVQADQMIRDIDYSQDRGEARAYTADKLARSKHALNQMMAPAEDALANMRNEIGAALSDAIAPVMSLVVPLIRGMADGITVTVGALRKIVRFLTGKDMDVGGDDDEAFWKHNIGQMEYMYEAWKDYAKRK